MWLSIRKYFNFPSKKEAMLIAEGCYRFIEMAKETSSKHYTDESNKQTEKDGICPNCGDNNIVNKISRVVGSGHVSGSFGSVFDNSKTDTNEVNNCNKCGNQWKKHNINHKLADDIIADWLNDLTTDYEFGYKTVELLKDIPAESIWKERKRVLDKCHYSTREILSLYFLRTKFKSVYK